MPGGPPLAMSALTDGGGAGALAERIVSVTWKAGTNTIAVKTCRYGDDFGFVLRILAPPASTDVQRIPPEAGS
jgi:hypothetical protein